MKKFKFIVISLIAILFFTGCNKISNEKNSWKKENRRVRKI